MSYEHAKIEVDAGLGIGVAAQQATAKAVLLGRPVEFEFNGTSVTARPGDSTATIIDLWLARREAASRGWKP